PEEKIRVDPGLLGDLGERVPAPAALEEALDRKQRQAVSLDRSPEVLERHAVVRELAQELLASLACPPARALQQALALEVDRHRRHRITWRRKCLLCRSSSCRWSFFQASCCRSTSSRSATSAWSATASSSRLRSGSSSATRTVPGTSAARRGSPRSSKGSTTAG